jgi:hypothetical protein
MSECLPAGTQAYEVDYDEESERISIFWSRGEETNLLDFPVEDYAREDIRELIDDIYSDESHKPNAEVLADMVINAMRSQQLLSTPLSMSPSSGAPSGTVDHTDHRRRPLLDRLRHLLQTLFPKLYAQVLEPTLADLRLEHSAALAEGRPWKARYVLWQGCGSLAAAAVNQLGHSALGRIAALWQAKSPK